MAVYKASMQIGRNGSAKHNGWESRSKYQDGHIDEARSGKNLYISYQNLPFTEAEKQFYTDRYSGWVKTQNDRCMKYRHPERRISVESLLHGSRTKPQEVILQIGDKDSHPDKAVFTQCVMDYLQELGKYSSHCHVLDAAVHNDEETPHCHVRMVFDYTDKDGNQRISTDRALKELGVGLPNPELPDNLRYNNRKITFDQNMRGRWHEICREHGLAIEEKGIDRKEHRDPKAYKYYQMEQDILSLQVQIRQLQAELEEQEKQHALINAELEKAERAYLEMNGPEALCEVLERCNVPDLVGAEDILQERDDAEH